MKDIFMRLNDRPFAQIKNGEKTIEVRLYDGKRKQIDVGDRLLFKRTNGEETISALVIALHKADTFLELFSSDILLKCGFGNMTPEEAVKEMREYYTESDEKKHGVVGIEIAAEICHE